MLVDCSCGNLRLRLLSCSMNIPPIYILLNALNRLTNQGRKLTKGFSMRHF